MNLYKSKFKAFFIHLLLSILLIGIVLLVTTNLWYPENLFRLENTWDALKILLPVDAILGPLLTFIVFSPKKKGLWIDLSIITGLQVAALAYGTWVIYEQRPVMLTFNVKQFEIITASEKIREDITPALDTKESIIAVYAVPPSNREEIAHYVLNSIPFQKEPARMDAITQYNSLIETEKLTLSAVEKLNPDKKREVAKAREILSQSNSIHLFRLIGSLGNTAIVAVNLESAKIEGFLDLKPPE